MAERRRRGYLDFMRGVAVLIMIEAHVVDSWTRHADRELVAFGWALVVGGFGAPLFLLLAGVSVALSAAAHARRLGDARAASNAVMRRGAEIFGLAFLFRVQAWILGWSSPRTLLKVDILNIMGPSIAAAAALWRTARSTRARAAVFATATAGTALLTPPIRQLPPSGMPDPIEAYIRPVSGLSNFVFFPWMAFVFAGALIGVLIDTTMTRGEEMRVNAWLGGAGAATALTAFGASYLPTPYPSSYFWTTSPAFFFLRAGLMAAGIALAYAWESRPHGRTAWSPVRQLGRTSLFIYWIHVEMVYGLVSRRIHGRLAFSQVWLAYALLCAFLLLCSLAWDAHASRQKGHEHRKSG